MRTTIEPARGASAIVCVSMRPYTLEAVVKHVSSQRAGGLDHDPDIVFVANSKDFERSAVEGAFSGIPNVRVVVPDEPMILGVALNIAAAMTDAHFVAKFDNNDLYGPCHLTDSLRAHSYSGAGVVGKHSYYADLIALDQRVIRFPANEYRYSSALAGGTLVWDRERTGDLAFMEVNLGEDQAFISDCHRRGVSSFSADRFNFVQVRASDNTWTIDDDSFLDGSTLAPAIDREVFR